MGYSNEVRRMAHELSSAQNGLVMPYALKALRDRALRYGRIQVSRCNDDPSDKPAGWEERRDSKETQLEDDMRQIIAEDFPKGFAILEFGGDPRGYTVKLKRPDGRYNTWGGAESGWGVEGS